VGHVFFCVVLPRDINAQKKKKLVPRRQKSFSLLKKFDALLPPPYPTLTTTFLSTSSYQQQLYFVSIMLMNYHEMTMNEPRDSPARKQQYLVICTIMAGAFVYSVLQAGGLVPVDVTQG
jgi:hypothetical protein